YPNPPLVAEEQSVAVPAEAREAVSEEAVSEEAASPEAAARKPASQEVETAGPAEPPGAPRVQLDDLQDEDGLGAIDREELALLDAAPIEMDSAPLAPRRRAALWLSLNLGLALLLAGQVAWTRFDELLANPRYRPALEFLCHQAGCAIATFRDLA